MSIILGNLRLDMSIEFDEITKKITVKSITTSYESNDVPELTEERKINESEYRYYILTFGTTSSFADHLPTGEAIKIEYEGKIYEGKVHSTTKARIDSLGSWYKNEKIQVGDRIKATYMAHQRLMKIEKLN